MRRADPSHTFSQGPQGSGKIRKKEGAAGKIATLEHSFLMSAAG